MEGLWPIDHCVGYQTRVEDGQLAAPFECKCEQVSIRDLRGVEKTTAVRTPFNFTTDLSVLKVFPLERLHKGASIEFRLEASNAFNHPTFGQPLTDVDDSLFGQITYSSSLPRQGQFGLKVTL